jgi:hypothetical protein
VGAVADALAAVLGTFRGVSVAGAALRAWDDPNDVVPPGVFVPLPEIAFRFSKRCLDLTWTAYLVGPNAPTARGTADSLAAMVDAVTGLFPFTSGDVFTLTPPGGGPAFTCYRLQWLDKIPIGGADNG